MTQNKRAAPGLTGPVGATQNTTHTKRIPEWCQIVNKATRGEGSPEVMTGDAPRVALFCGVGLSKCHNCTQGEEKEPYAEITVALDGYLVEARFRFPGRGSRGGKRGRIHGFSRRSRSRLMRRLGMVSRHADLPVFITLTYPEQYPGPSEAKRHLRAFLMRLRRRYPNSGWVWRMEFQKRGAPHFHLLVWGVKFIPWVWVARSWYEVVGSGDPRHFYAGTRVEAVRSWRGVVAYASKYIAKEADHWEGWTGRVWGFGGRVPWAVRVVVERLPLGAVVDFMRLVRRGLGMRRAVIGRGFWAYSRDPAVWLAVAGVRFSP